VGDNLHAVADAHLLHAAGEQYPRWKHVRKRGGLVRNFVDVKEERARDVLRQILGPGIAIGGGQMHGAVKHDETRRVEVPSQPSGLDQPVLRVVGHCVSSQVIGVIGSPSPMAGCLAGGLSARNPVMPGRATRMTLRQCRATPRLHAKETRMRRLSLPFFSLFVAPPSPPSPPPPPPPPPPPSPPPHPLPP